MNIKAKNTKYKEEGMVEGAEGFSIETERAKVKSQPKVSFRRNWYRLHYHHGRIGRKVFTNFHFIVIFVALQSLFHDVKSRDTF